MSSPLTALTPLDGRYASKTRPLQEHFSEFALIRERVAIEIAWLLALSSETSFAPLAPLSPATVEELKAVAAGFGVADAERVKAIEATTNHDVKAVEYWLRERLGGNAEVKAAAEFIHFACTSEDINNLAHARMVKAARERVLLPAIDRIIARVRSLAAEHADLAMLARTHGQ
ncbi:MAG TPA: lyase family protein, partial [Usitatibacter sp.]|nr:lyase family protein [Usitatibacter sp.]